MHLELDTHCLLCQVVAVNWEIFPKAFISLAPTQKENKEDDPSLFGTHAPISGDKRVREKHKKKKKAPIADPVVVEEEATEEWFESIGLADPVVSTGCWVTFYKKKKQNESPNGPFRYLWAWKSFLTSKPLTLKRKWRNYYLQAGSFLTSGSSKVEPEFWVQGLKVW